MIETVIFDVGGVLLELAHDKIMEELSEKYSLSLNTLNEFTTDPWKRVMLGQLNESEHFEAVIKEFNIPLSMENFQKRIFELSTIRKEDVWDIVKELKGKYDLAILSDIGNEWGEIRKNFLNLSMNFKPVVYSCSLGISKPDSRIFEHALKEIGKSADKCLFIDDRLRNIEMARKLGMHAIQYKDTGQLRKELMKLGVLK